MSDPNDENRPPDEPAGEAADDQAAEQAGDQVGSVGDEAAKLLGALSEWARDQGTDVGQGLSGLAGHAAASVREINDHIDTGSAECTYCPICRIVHVVRQTSPEVRAHLVSAASSFLQAAAGMLATLPPPDGGSGRGAGVEKIDLDEDDEG